MEFPAVLGVSLTEGSKKGSHKLCHTMDLEGEGVLRGVPLQNKGF